MEDGPVRAQVARLLGWEDAHVGLESAVRDLAPELRGVRPPGLPHSAWELLEHMRLAQRDLLDFSRDADYRQPRWPEEYWPASPVPPDDRAWEESVRALLADREELIALARDPGLDLTARIPHGDGQTYLRELLLAADHAAYHLGQLVLVRRALNAWPAA